MTKGYERGNYVKVTFANTTDESGVMQCFLDVRILHTDRSSNCKSDNGLIHNEE